MQNVMLLFLKCVFFLQKTCYCVDNSQMAQQIPAAILKFAEKNKMRSSTAIFINYIQSMCLEKIFTYFKGISFEKHQKSLNVRLSFSFW